MKEEIMNNKQSTNNTVENNNQTLNSFSQMNTLNGYTINYEILNKMTKDQ